VWRDPFPGQTLDPRVRQLLTEFASRVVVIGSVARRSTAPGDLDLLLDERAEDRVRKRIKELRIPFDSAFVGSWTFCTGDCPHLQVEILPIHLGPDYRTVRRRVSVQSILGLDLLVAQPEDAG
jgi:hypothetical protein